MKPKDPIPFSSILEFYAEEEVLKRPKDELIKEIKDIITISDFMICRIPTVMKSLKETVKMQQTGIRDLNNFIRSGIVAQTSGPKNNQWFYLDSAYDLLSHFPLNKFTDVGGSDKTIAEKEMKLKFLQSQNLPSDFLWDRPSRQSRDKSKQQKPQKDPYAHHTHFNPRLNMLEINTRKYRILISMIVEKNRYKWAIDRIHIKINQEIVYWMKEYFDDKVRKALQAKYEDHYENNLLAGIDCYSYFLELMELNLGLCVLTTGKFFNEKIAYNHGKDVFEFTFNKPEDLGKAEVTIIRKDCPDLIIQLKFHKKQTQCIFKIGQIITVQTNDHFKYDNVKYLIYLLQTLIEYGGRAIEFVKNCNFQDKISHLEKKLFIKLSGMFFVFGNVDWVTTAKSYMINQDGIYIGSIILKQLTYCSILNNGILSSPKVYRTFLNRLTKELPNFDIFMTFVYIMTKVIRQNGQKECELDHYYVGDPNKENQKEKIQLQFRRKACSEDQMIKGNNVRCQPNQEETFNSIKFLVQINFVFDEVLFYHYRDPDQRIPFQKEDWKQYFNPKLREPPGPLDIAKVVEAIQYVQENIIFKYVIEKKMKSESKPLYNIKI